MTTDQTPLSARTRTRCRDRRHPGRHRAHTQGFGETIGALSAKADVKGRAKKKATDTRDSITEKASETKNVVVEKAHAAQSAARDAVTDNTGSVKPRVPIAALIAAVAVLVVSLVVWRRRR